MHILSTLIKQRQTENKCLQIINIKMTYITQNKLYISTLQNDYGEYPIALSDKTIN